MDACPSSECSGLLVRSLCAHTPRKRTSKERRLKLVKVYPFDILQLPLCVALYMRTGAGHREP